MTREELNKIIIDNYSRTVQEIEDFWDENNFERAHCTCCDNEMGVVGFVCTCCGNYVGCVEVDKAVEQIKQ